MEHTSARTSAPQTLPAIKTHLDYFYHWEETRPDAVYLKQPLGGQWTDYSWREVGNQARRIASALRAMKLPPQSHIGLISKNCAHWIICDLAIMMSGHVSVPFYPNLTAEQLRQVMEHSECKVLFAGKLDDLSAVREGVPEGVRRIALPLCKAGEFDQWDELLKQYEPIADNPLPDPDDLQTIVYTSGTTGVPKGVMKTYRQTCSPISPVMEVTGMDRIEGRFFSYLPLNHDAERAVVESTSLVNGGTIYFAESLDTFVQNLQEASPTIFLAVPRIWTKFQMGVLEKIPPKRLDLLLRIPLLSGFIKKKIRQGLGLDSLYMAISGAAPISADTLNWYRRIGVNICEGYGMTENSAVCTINPLEDTRVGTVGKAYPGCEVRIDPVTHEVLMKAEWVMKGYYKNPELSAQVVREGWLHTGDMGELTEDGYLRITGRVKDMFKTSKGEYVIPVPIEHMFASNPWIEQICVVGYGQPQPFALINLSEAAGGQDRELLRRQLNQTLAEVNGHLADYEQIHKLVVTREQWTVESGFVTPTLKVKRNVLDEYYREKMTAWYGDGEDAVIWE